jgi:hypothetical protein
MVVSKAVEEGRSESKDISPGNGKRKRLQSNSGSSSAIERPAREFSRSFLIFQKDNLKI